MSAKKVIAIVGATGNQGGALVRAILKEGANSQFIARAITRDTSSEKAQALKKAGAQLAQADAFNERSLTDAVKGCHGMYCVTALEFGNMEKEKQQARTMATAAKKAGVRHVIWSTLDDTRNLIPEDTTIPTLHSSYKVPHFDVKAESDKYFGQLPTTFLLTTFYWENFMTFFPPRKTSDGKLCIALPMGNKTFPGIAADDIGKCALGIFKRGQIYFHKKVGIAAESLTMAQITAKMSKALGKEIAYYPLSFDAFRGFGFPGAADLANMFQFYQDCETKFVESRDVNESRKLNPELMTFDQWLAKYKNRIPIE